jgi:hypothetical protein
MNILGILHRLWLPAVLIVVTCFVAPARADDDGEAATIGRLVAEILASPPDRHPRSISRHVLLGRTYFYVPAPCCDQYNRLYTAEGVYLCAPDGGVHGGGTRDRECPPLRLNRAAGSVVWQDPRPAARP